MTSYRYVRGVGDPVPITKFVPGAVIQDVSNTYIDVDVNPLNKEDLDSYMASIGFTYVGLTSAGLTLNQKCHTTPYDWASNFGNYRCRNIGIGVTWNHTIRVPSDFVSLVSLKLRFIPNAAGVDRTFRVAVEYGAENAQWNQHNGSNIDFLHSESGGDLTDIDITSVFTTVGAPLGPNYSLGVGGTNVDASQMSFIDSKLTYIGYEA